MAGRKQKAQESRQRWFLYLLRCSDKTLYTGITTDLERRLEQHNEGVASRYTRSRTPVVMVYSESCDDHGAALRREHAVKALKREEKEALVGKKKKRASSARTKNRAKKPDLR